MKRQATVYVTLTLLASIGLPAHASDAERATAQESRDGTPGAQPARVITETELRAELSSHKGRITVLHFWATWCEPCLTELPFLAKLARDLKRKGIDFVAVSLDSPSEKSARQVGKLLAERVRDARWSAILKVTDVGAFMSSIDPKWDGVIPVFFVYDHDSRLRRSHYGNLSQGDLDRLISPFSPTAKP